MTSFHIFLDVCHPARTAYLVSLRELRCCEWPVGPVRTYAYSVLATRAHSRSRTRTHAAVLGVQQTLEEILKHVTRICPVGLGVPPARLLPPPSISASTRSTAGSENVDEPSGLTRPAAGGAEGSTGVRKMPRGSQSARHLLMWSVGQVQHSRKWKARALRPWSCTSAVYCFRAPASFPPLSTPDSRSYSHASPHAFASKPSRRTAISQLSHPAGTMMRSRSSVFGLCENGNTLRAVGKWSGRYEEGV
jgi:hypothetical protein